MADETLGGRSLSPEELVELLKNLNTEIDDDADSGIADERKRQILSELESAARRLLKKLQRSYDRADVENLSEVLDLLEAEELNVVEDDGANLREKLLKELQSEFLDAVFNQFWLELASGQESFAEAELAADDDEKKIYLDGSKTHRQNASSIKLLLLGRKALLNDRQQESLGDLSSQLKELTDKLMGRVVTPVKDSSPTCREIDISNFEDDELFPSHLKELVRLMTEYQGSLDSGSFASAEDVSKAISQLEAQLNLIHPYESYGYWIEYSKRVARVEITNPIDVALHVKTKYVGEADALLTKLRSKEKELKDAELSAELKAAIDKARADHPELKSLEEMLAGGFPESLTKVGLGLGLFRLEDNINLVRSVLSITDVADSINVAGVSDFFNTVLANAFQVRESLQRRLFDSMRDSIIAVPARIADFADMQMALQGYDTVPKAGATAKLNAINNAWSKIDGSFLRDHMIVTSLSGTMLFPREEDEDWYAGQLAKLEVEVQTARAHLGKEVFDITTSGLRDYVLQVNSIVPNKYEASSASGPLALSDLKELQEKLGNSLRGHRSLLIDSGDEGVALEQRAEKAVGKLDGIIREVEKPEQARERISEIWARIRENETVLKGSNLAPGYLDAPYEDSIQKAGLYALVKEFFPDDIRRWEIMIQLHNGFMTGAGKDVFKQFAYGSWKEARGKVASHVGFKEIREFMAIPEVSPVFTTLEEIFQGPYKQTITVNVDGVDKEKQVTHDYAQHGNPDAAKTAAGYMTISEILQKNHPNVPKEIIDAVEYAGVIGEIRLKYFGPYYGGYLKSPDGTFAAPEVMSVHSPMHALTYKIRSNGILIPNLRMFWQIFRFPEGEDPSKGGMYTECVTRGTTRDRKNHEGFGDEWIYPEVDYRDPPDNTDPIKEASASKWRGVNNGQVADAIEVRTWVDWALTTCDREFAPVRLGRDLTVLPYYWDVLTARDEHDPSKFKFGALSYEEYNLAFQKWEEFALAAQYPQKISSPEDVNDRVLSLISKLSPAKALFGLMPSRIEEGKRFRDLIGQMLLRYLKHVYDQYITTVKYTYEDRMRRGLTARHHFFNSVIKTIENAGTLESSIKSFILGKLREYQKITTHDNLFSQCPGNPLSVPGGFLSGRAMRERARREEMIENFVQKPPPDDKS